MRTFIYLLASTVSLFLFFYLLSPNKQNFFSWRLVGFERFDFPTDTKTFKKNDTIKSIQLSEDEEMTEIFWSASQRTIQQRKAQCEQRKLKYSPVDVFYEADCGAGYNIENSTEKLSDWEVVFAGSSFRSAIMKMLSGCPEHCPLSPNCRIIYASNFTSLKNPQVVVFSSGQAQSLIKTALTRFGRDPFYVLYWREALWDGPNKRIQSEDFDFEMGVHQTSAILNPSFVVTPTALKFGLFRNVQKDPTHFAASIISHCTTPSHRELYLAYIVKYLGSERVHRYGNCGDVKPPPKPFKNAMKLVASYKLLVCVAARFALKANDSVQQVSLLLKIHFKPAMVRCLKK